MVSYRLPMALVDAYSRVWVVWQRQRLKRGRKDHGERMQRIISCHTKGESGATMDPMRQERARKNQQERMEGKTDGNRMGGRI